MILVRIIFLHILGIQLFAQSVQVVETVKLNADIVSEAFYPRFVENDKSVIYSAENYKGLYKFDLQTKNITVITEKDGAGYNPIILSGEGIIFRVTEFINRLKYHSVVKYTGDNKLTEIIEEKTRLLKLPHQLENSTLIILSNSQPKQFNIDGKKLSKSSTAKAIYAVDNSLILVQDEEEVLLNPLGKGIYVWESISKDGQKIVFTFENQGSFITDLEGNIQHNIAEAHYPRLSPDGKFLSYMIDKDNGYNYISSDLYIYSLAEGKSVKITNTADRIEMFPEWSESSDKIVYNTTEGEIFITSLQFQN